MTLTTSTPVSFEQAITEGMGMLICEIQNALSANKRPLLLTVSRRMPHIIFWYRHCIASVEECQIFDNLDVITEIALPFIDFSKQKDNLRLIIVDDVVYSGNTLNYVMNLTRAMSNIEDFKALTFFYNVGAENLFVREKDQRIHYARKFDSNEYKQITNFISTIIAVTLPIDVSYPLLYMEEDIDVLEFNRIGEEWFKDRDGTADDVYDLEICFKTELSIGNEKKVKVGDKKRSITSLLKSELSNSLNNDFAKIRIYKRLGSTVIMSYAPNILQNSDLTDYDLFECPQYKEIWIRSLKMVRKDWLDKVFILNDDYNIELGYNRACRSLVSVANYLYSISSFVRNIKDNRTSNVRRFIIKYEDLALIVGNVLAEELLPKFQFIIDNRLESPKAHRKLNIGSVFIPEDYYSEYTVSKYLCIEDNNEDLESNLRSIFLNASEKSSEFPAVIVEDTEYNVEGIMESFESLEKALLVKDYRHKVEINKWVDQKIDEGVLVSRYAYTYDQSGTKYWRRFFRKTSLAF